MFALACDAKAQIDKLSKVALPDSARQYIRSIIRELPEGDKYRKLLESGAVGTGVRELWMDRMAALGIRQAVFKAEWNTPLLGGTESDRRVLAKAYFSQYDPSCTQIIDPKSAQRIRDTGLDDVLTAVAFARGQSAPVTTKRPFTHRRAAIVQLVDNEWLPTFPVRSFPSSAESPPAFNAIEVGDQAGVANMIVHQQLSHTDLTGLLILAVGGSYVPSTGSPDRTCTIRLLTSAGAEPNGVTATSATTPMSVAIGSCNPLALRSLLEAGADIAQVPPPLRAHACPDIQSLLDSWGKRRQ
jgi:hypothetical protein